jgi:serine-type D-Ala-D-Ala carboxypeptidase/endopeptidase (penicillin-binding protein 4)
MIKLLKYILIILPFFSQANDRIDKVLDNNKDFIRKISLTMQVKDLETEEEIYSISPDRLMIPASTTKSFTSYAALEYLGPEFTYSTQVLFDENKIDSKNVLIDDLYIKFLGDPSLTRQELFKLMDGLKKYNIKDIKGDVVIDDFIFDQGYQADGWPWDDSKFCFAAPTSAIVINGNCFFLNLSPSKASLGIAKLTGSSFVESIRNKIITKKDKNCSPELAVYQDNSYDLTGCIDSRSEFIPLRIAYQDPRLMIKKIIRASLKEQKILLKGNIVFKVVPSKYNPVLENKSINMSELLKKVQKDSNNVYADNIAKTIGAKYYKTQGDFSNATKAISKITDNKEMVIKDGSGGSRYNLISSNHLVDLFIKAYKNQKIWPYFYDSLSISGVDGFLKKRFINTPLIGKIRAKTGYMGGVTALAGYLEKDDGRVLVFSIMINGSMDRKKGNKLMEEILEAVASN